MCKYCSEATRYDDENNAKDLAFRKIKTIFGTTGIQLCISPYKDLCVAVISDGRFERVAGKKINYCPICGREL